ncbi:AfsR/SARP family transcriptional regulator [Saccharomonospora xinjiangensis]|uniref:DNA-binding transcriptional activator of the SARP family n=1 Tax=Saccharomonospora xinjiangensis XJ-54 TaxID=882086 RepID=I0V8F1_9PSEU|nr:BTAD domain-containing putative transcriptional regulator [Saccharomonospora xinjiangensis]EID56404.1 DNA-binding transcriptional activator of the SARP family [Saccharomonospora xinjiangensis XJ-54]
MHGSRTVEFRLLGPVGVRLHGQNRPVGGPRQRAVLVALLLHANKELPTARLLELVWHDLPTSAPSNLRTYLTRLRRALRVPGEPESRLRTGRGGHLVHVRPGELDLATFTDLAAKGERATNRAVACRYFESALATWHGRALDTVALGPQLEAEAAQLEARREQVREQYLMTRLALGRHAEVLPELRALLLKNPLWERVAAMLMLALHRCGQRTEALTVFRQTRVRLVEELGIEPGTELRSLHQQLLAGGEGDSFLLAAATPGRAVTSAGGTGGEPAQPCDEPPAPPAPRAVLGERHSPHPAELPADLPSFTGRAAELAELLGDCFPEDDRGPAITTVDGMAGVGKTTLAVHAAHRLAPAFPDGQLFVDLRGHTPGTGPLSPDDALGQMVHALGVAERNIPGDITARANLFRSLLADRAVLVLLDDAHSEEQVRPLLPGAGVSRTVITSRTRLTGLPQAHPVSLDILPLHDAVTLFTRVAGAARLSGQRPALLAEVAKLCGQLPLALRIAATRFRDRPSWTLEHLRERLRDHRRTLRELCAGGHGVAGAFTVSMTRIGPEARRVLALLSLNPATSMHLNAAAALAGLGVAEADRVLERLVDAHLLRQSAPYRYELHNLLAAFLADRVRSQHRADVHAAMRRLLDCYLHTADATDLLIHPAPRRTPLTPPDPVVVPLTFGGVEQALSWWDDTHPHLRRLVEAAEEHGFDEHAWQLPLRLTGYFDLRGHWHDAIAVYETALAAARRSGESAAESELLLGMAFGHAQLHRYEEAADHYAEALAVCRESGNLYAEGFAAMALAEVCRRLRRHDEAEGYRKVAIDVYRGRGGDEAIAATLDHLRNTVWSGPRAPRPRARTARTARQTAALTGSCLVPITVRGRSAGSGS